MYLVIQFMLFFLSALQLFNFSCEDLRKKKKAVVKQEKVYTYQGYTYNIPQLDNIIIDGKIDDWKNKGLEVKLFANLDGNIHRDENFAANFKMAWSKDGILIYTEITDNQVTNGDEINILLSNVWGENNTVRFSLSPEVQKDSLKLSVRTQDYRTNKSGDIKIHALASKTAKGYIVEALLPFDNFKSTISESQTLGFQLNILDYDDNQAAKRINWGLAKSDNDNSHTFQRIRLSKKNETSIKSDVKCWLRADSVFIGVYGDATWLNKKITLKSNQKGLGEKLMSPTQSYATTLFAFPISVFNSSRSPIYVYNDTTLQSIVDLQLIVNQNIANSNYSFYKDIRIYEMRDLYSMPAQNGVVFVGSSSFARWKTLENDMRGIVALNRSFGGSQIKHVLHYADRVIFKYRPSKVVVYEGDNDIALGVSPQNFADSCRLLAQRIHEKLPQTQVYFISIKPSPARKKYWDTTIEANRLLSQLPKDMSFVHYIDVTEKMFANNGNLRKDIWFKDKLHMNQRGYDIWTSIIKPVLINQ